MSDMGDQDQQQERRHAAPRNHPPPRPILSLFRWFFAIAITISSSSSVPHPFQSLSFQP